MVMMVMIMACRQIMIMVTMIHDEVGDYYHYDNDDPDPDDTASNGEIQVTASSFRATDTLISKEARLVVRGRSSL